MNCKYVLILFVISHKKPNIIKINDLLTHIYSLIIITPYPSFISDIEVIFTHRIGGASFCRSGCFSGLAQCTLAFSALFTNRLSFLAVSLATKGLKVGSRFFTSASEGLSSYTLKARNCATGGTMFFSFFIWRTVLFSS